MPPPRHEHILSGLGERMSPAATCRPASTPARTPIASTRFQRVVSPGTGEPPRRDELSSDLWQVSGTDRLMKGSLGIARSVSVGKWAMRSGGSQETRADRQSEAANKHLGLGYFELPSEAWVRDLDADSAACVVAGLEGNLTGAPWDRAVGEKLSTALRPSSILRNLFLPLRIDAGSQRLDGAQNVPL